MEGNKIKLKKENTWVRVCGLEFSKDGKLPEEQPGNAVGLCDIDNGYHGVICASCLPGFKRKGKFEC